MEEAQLRAVGVVDRGWMAGARVVREWSRLAIARRGKLLLTRCFGEEF